MKIKAVAINLLFHRAWQGTAVSRVPEQSFYKICHTNFVVSLFNKTLDFV